MEKVAKVYVCGACECRFYDGHGGCDRKADTLTIGKNGVCGNYSRMNVSGKILAQALLAEIETILLEEYGDPMQEDLSQFELYTDSENNCFMCREGSQALQDFACDEGVACLVNAYNVIMHGKPLHCKIAD